MAGLTLVGLGPGGLDQITLEARHVLTAASEIWISSPRHPFIDELPESVSVRELSRDMLGDPAALAGLMELCRRPQGVMLALPGHPLIESSFGRLIWSRASELGIPLRLVSAPLLLDLLISAVPADTLARLFVCSASSLDDAHIPPFPPDSPALVTGIRTSAAFSALGTLMETTYPPGHLVTALTASPTATRVEVSLTELAELDPGGVDACIYVPPLASGSSLEALQEVIAHLRAPEGCPWDRKQTHASLRPHLLEEAYEAMTAMDSGDASAMREEFGDLLLQIMLNAQIAAEAGDFTLNDVTHSIHEKLIRRHPHVFGELDLDDVDGVLSNWERLKEGERAEKGESSGLLEGVPPALPALSLAQEYQDRASRVGFDWPLIAGVLEKIGEEVREVQAAADVDALEAELGDLLFSLVNFARWKGVDAESALRAANQRFRRRFRFIEAGAQRQGRRLSELTLQEMNGLWNQAKGMQGAASDGA
jgi:tetrapyrrole methylase family protein/MazG family protein